MKWWNPEEAMKLIEKFRITFMTLVPTMYIHILDNRMWTNMTCLR